MLAHPIVRDRPGLVYRRLVPEPIPAENLDATPQRLDREVVAGVLPLVPRRDVETTGGSAGRDRRGVPEDPRVGLLPERPVGESPAPAHHQPDVGTEGCDRVAEVLGPPVPMRQRPRIGRVVDGPVLARVDRPSHRAIVAAGIVESGSTERGLIDEPVVAPASDGPHDDRGIAGPDHRRTVGAALEVQPNLPGLAGVETAPEERRAAGPWTDRHLDHSGIDSLDHRELGLVRARDVDLGRQHFVVAPGHGAKPAPPGLEGAQQPRPVGLPHLGREPGHRLLEHLIGDPRLEDSGHRIPDRPLELGQEPAIQIAPVPRRPDDGRILRSEVDELRHLLPNHAKEKPVEANEGLIAVA
ncbi:MAG: hypothetical protein SFV24_17170, partial [Gemmatimonadales bacterium]|nr:hypothetical protein [Gemmatimonadales bacterium]